MTHDTRGAQPARARHRAPQRRHLGDPRGLHAPLRPRSYRRWTPAVVATSALGGIAYLADFSIGRANIGIAHGTTIRAARNRRRGRRHLRQRVPAGLLTRPLQHRPRPHTADRFRVLRVGRHNVIFATFTSSFRPRGFDHGPGPRTRPRASRVWIGYALSTLVVIPLVRLRHEGAVEDAGSGRPRSGSSSWSSPSGTSSLEPRQRRGVLRYTGADGSGSTVSVASVLLAGVSASRSSPRSPSRIDYLRFMPPAYGGEHAAVVGPPSCSPVPAGSSSAH